MYSFCCKLIKFRLSGGIYQPATIGDVDGDGQLDVVVSVSAYNGYHIYALRGDTGSFLLVFIVNFLLFYFFCGSLSH